MYRIGLGILDCLQKSIYKSRNKQELLSVLQSGATQLVDETNLIKRSFYISFSRADIHVLSSDVKKTNVDIFYKPKPNIPSSIISLNDVLFIDYFFSLKFYGLSFQDDLLFMIQFKYSQLKKMDLI